LDSIYYSYIYKLNSLNNSTISNVSNLEKKVVINETPLIQNQEEFRRASVTSDEVMSGNCKYEFLIPQFAKVFGENLENYDERGN